MNRRRTSGCPKIVIGPEYMTIFMSVWILLLAETGFGGLQADINGDGVVNFHDFSVLANQWLNDSNGTSLKPKYVINYPSLGINRDSIAYDADFRKLPENVARYEDICIASRPDRWQFDNLQRLRAGLHYKRWGQLYRAF
jgi:hypothetical protein